MARHSHRGLVDDLDGIPADQTVVFDLDELGPFEIDLSAENAEKLRSLLFPYIAAARLVRAGNER